MFAYAAKGSKTPKNRSMLQAHVFKTKKGSRVSVSVFNPYFVEKQSQIFKYVVKIFIKSGENGYKFKLNAL